MANSSILYFPSYTFIFGPRETLFCSTLSIPPPCYVTLNLHTTDATCNATGVYACCMLQQMLHSGHLSVFSEPSKERLVAVRTGIAKQLLCIHTGVKHSI